MFARWLARYTCSLRLALEQQQTAGEEQGGPAGLRTSPGHGMAPLDRVVVLNLADELRRGEQAVVAGGLLMRLTSSKNSCTILDACYFS